MTRYLVAAVLAAAAIPTIVLAQQPGGVDEIRARAAQDLANQAALSSSEMCNEVKAKRNRHTGV